MDSQRGKTFSIMFSLSTPLNQKEVNYLNSIQTEKQALQYLMSLLISKIIFDFDDNGNISLSIGNFEKGIRFNIENDNETFRELFNVLKREDRLSLKIHCTHLMRKIKTNREKYKHVVELLQILDCNRTELLCNTSPESVQSVIDCLDILQNENNESLFITTSQTGKRHYYSQLFVPLLVAIENFVMRTTTKYVIHPFEYSAELNDNFDADALLMRVNKALATDLDDRNLLRNVMVKSAAKSTI